MCCGWLFLLACFPSNAQSDTSWYFVLRPELGYTFSSMNVPRIPNTVSCCGDLGLGTGEAYGATLGLEKSVGWGFLEFNIGYRYDAFSFERRESVPISIDGTDGRGTVAFVLDGSLSSFEIGAGISVRIVERLRFTAGLDGVFTNNAAYVQEERLIEPVDRGMLVHEDGTTSRTRNTYRSQFFIQYGMRSMFGIAYEVPLSQSVRLVPVLSWRVDILSIADDFFFRRDRFALGLGFEFSLDGKPARKTKPPEPIPADNVPTSDEDDGSGGVIFKED